MYYLILHVLHDQSKLETMLDAWKNAGVKGVTVLQSIGMRKLQEEASLLEDMPLIPTINSLFESGETLNRTLFTVVEGEELVDKVIAETQSITGDLNNHGTGILIVLPIVKALGLHRNDD